jgi:ADP-ribosylglycohydrolase
MRERFKGCVLGLAVGDALGYPVENIHTMEEIRERLGPDGVTGLMGDALYSDDTQMAICVAEALMEPPDPKKEPLDVFMTSLCRKLVNWYELQTEEPDKHKRTPSTTSLLGCQRLAGGSGWDMSGSPSSKGCGSVVRAAPIGMFFDGIGEVLEFAKESSRPTHGHLAPMCASACGALMVNLAKRDEPTGTWAEQMATVSSGVCDEMTRLVSKAVDLAVSDTPPEKAICPRVLGEGWLGHEAVAAALYCCLRSPDDYRRGVLMAVNTAGNSDGLGALTGAVLGARLGVGAIPEEWVSKVEGSKFLSGLADGLCEAYEKRQEVP